MASSGGEEKAPIIIKKVHKGEEGHHGGAWKVAYADFVTAMMAFFLLLWLLSVTTAEQKLGLADYFSPASPSRQQSGAGGVLGGKTITVDGAAINASSPIAMRIPVDSPPSPNNPASDKDNSGSQGGPGQTPGRTNANGQDNESGQNGQYDQNGQNGQNGQNNGPVSDQELKEALAQREEQQFSQMEQDLRQAIQQVPELKNLEHNLIMQRTPQGERLSLVDQEGYSMFPSGSAKMNPQTAQLLSLVAQAVAKLPNKLSITGHTDSIPYATPNGGASPSYSNWELSTDRANACRRALQASGVPASRFQSVVGRADNDPLFPNDPKSPRNRRISIVLLRDNPLQGAPPGPGQPTTAPDAPPSVAQPPHP